MYILALLLPPLAVLLCGKPLQALLNVVLTLFFLIPGVIHAILVVNSREQDKRTAKIVKEMRKRR